MDQISPTSAGKELEPRNRIPHQNSDEIDLIDLWLILMGRKKTILTSIILSLLAGIAIVFIQTESYTYRTSIEIGKNITNLQQGGDAEDGYQLIESPASTLAKLTNIYIPLAQSEQSQAVSANIPLQIDAIIPDDSDIILLESRGDKNLHDFYVKYHADVVKRIMADHDNLLQAPRQTILHKIEKIEFDLSRLESPEYYKLQLNKHENALHQAKVALENLKDPRLTDVTEKELIKKIDDAIATQKSIKSSETLLREKLAQIDKRRELLQEETENLNKLVIENMEMRANAIKEASNEAKAMTLLLIDNLIQRSQERLSKLKRDLEVNLATEKKQIENQLLENLRSQATQATQIEILKSKRIKANTLLERGIEEKSLTIAQLELELDNFKNDYQRKISRLKTDRDQLQERLALIQDTQPISSTISIENKTTSPLVIVAISIVLGMILGILAAFLLSFAESAKMRQKTETLTHHNT